MSKRARRDSPPLPPRIDIVADHGRSVLAGVLGMRTLAEAARWLRSWSRRSEPRVLDLRDLSGLDTPGALLLCDLRGEGVKLAGVDAGHKALLDFI